MHEFGNYLGTIEFAAMPYELDEEYEAFLDTLSRDELLEDGLLAAVGDEHLGGVDLQMRGRRDRGGQRLAQLGQSGRGGVAVVARIARGLDGGLDDVLRGGEVGLAGAEADHGPAGGLQRLRGRVHGEGRRGLDRADALGDAGTGGGGAGVVGGHGSIVAELAPPRQDLPPSDRAARAGPRGAAGAPFREVGM